MTDLMNKLAAVVAAASLAITLVAAGFAACAAFPQTTEIDVYKRQVPRAAKAKPPGAIAGRFATCFYGCSLRQAAGLTQLVGLVGCLLYTSRCV